MSTARLEAQDDNHAPRIGSRRDLARLAVGALGVVYGDIGTSPLYALKECFGPAHGLAVTSENVLGVLSLVFWALMLVVVVKYLTLVMRADNRGEGGILALVALVLPRSATAKQSKRTTVILLAGLFGAALLYGDGMITPAISVLSAIEGLEVATTRLTPFVVPVTIVILIGVFLIQRSGTAKIGAIFGPTMLVWFAGIGALGVPWIVKHPSVLWAMNPAHAVRFLVHGGMHTFLLLGSVVLCITGAEALYADMGHFGRKPIRFAWYVLVMPALLLNYFGQGALLLEAGPVAKQNPFFAMAPSITLYPLVVLATMATVIASQALISGAFSLTQQAVHLGYWPRVKIVHTSGEQAGQIYIPEINHALMVACVALVLGFKSSSNLAAAYGIAVTGTMSITTVLLYSVAVQKWGWSRWRAAAFCLPLLGVDLRLPQRQRTQGRRGRLVPARHRRGGVHDHDHVAKGARDPRGVHARGHAPDPALHAGRRGQPASSRERHRGLHDPAARRRTAGPPASPQAQQGAPRAGGAPLDLDGGRAHRPCRGARGGGRPRSWFLPCHRALRLHAVPRCPQDAASLRAARSRR